MLILTRPRNCTLTEMKDKAAVKELVEFERFCRDNALWDEMKKCFTEDSIVDISWYQGSGYGFVEASRKMKTRAPHKIYNTEVWLNGDKAVAIMMTSIQTRTELNGITMDLSSDAKLVFRVVKKDELWYILSFTGIYEQDSLVPAYPKNNANLPDVKLEGYRQSYACLSYVLDKVNSTPVNNNLPGIDKPDLVKNLYSEIDRWLQEK